MRPLPLPLRAARRLTESGPAICQSALEPSLLVIPVTRQIGLGSTASDTATLMVTGTIFLFGGRITVTLGLTWPITGGRVSRITSEPDPEDASRSRAASPANATLTGNVPMPDITETLAIPDAFVTAVAVVAPTLNETGSPLTASPAGVSRNMAVTVTGAPASLLAGPV